MGRSKHKPLPYWKPSTSDPCSKRFSKTTILYRGLSKLKVWSQPGVVAHAFSSSSGGIDRHISDFMVCLVYEASSKIARAIERNTVSKTNEQPKTLVQWVRNHCSSLNKKCCSLLYIISLWYFGYRKTLLGIMQKHHLSIKSRWPISKRQEIRDGSSGRETGTLWVSERREDWPPDSEVTGIWNWGEVTSRVTHIE